jgi:hypothetical protein
MDEWAAFDAHINSIIRVNIPIFPPETTEYEKNLAYQALVEESQRRIKEREKYFVAAYESTLTILDDKKRAKNDLLTELETAEENVAAVSLTEIEETAKLEAAKAALAAANAIAAAAQASGHVPPALTRKIQVAAAEVGRCERRLITAREEIDTTRKKLAEVQEDVDDAEAEVHDAEAEVNRTEQVLSRFVMIVNFSKIHPCINKDSTIVSKQSFPDSKQILSNNFAPVEPELEPIDKIKDSTKSIHEIFPAKTPIDHSATYNPSNNINALIDLAPVSGSIEKLWLEKLINDMKINYMALQTNILHDYHIKALAKLPIHLQEKYKNMLQDPYKEPISHNDILKDHLTKLFKDFDFDKSQTQKYMDRLNAKH